MDTVYIAHGSRAEAAFGLGQKISLLPISVDSVSQSRRDFLNLTQYVPDIKRPLSAQQTFLIIEDASRNLRGHACDNDEAYNPGKSGILTSPSYDPLKTYLKSTQQDRVIVTQSQILKRVDEIVKELEFDTIHFE